MKHYDDDRIREALALEFGGEWHSLEKLHQSDTKSNAWTDKDDRWWYQSNVLSVKIDITARMERALEVTAPWEWAWSRTGHMHCAMGSLYAHSTPVPWWFRVDGVHINGESDSVEDAQRAARAAYLRWMKGGRA